MLSENIQVAGAGMMLAAASGALARILGWGGYGPFIAAFAVGLVAFVVAGHFKGRPFPVRSTRVANRILRRDPQSRSLPPFRVPSSYGNQVNFARAWVAHRQPRRSRWITLPYTAWFHRRVVEPFIEWAAEQGFPDHRLGIYLSQVPRRDELPHLASLISNLGVRYTAGQKNATTP